MDTSTGITPVMPIGNMGDGFTGGGSFMWIFGLIVLLALFNGGFGGINGNTAAALGYENLATSNELQRGFADQNITAQTRDILSAVTSGTAQTIAASTANASNAINAIKDGNAALVREFGTVETALTALSGKMQECCCTTQQAIMQANYDGAMRDAATNANITAQIQSVKDAMAQDKIEALQAQINALQLSAAVSGVVRYPSSTTYSSGCNPFCGCSYGNV